MHHIDALFIFGKGVGSTFNKEFYEFHIPMEGSEVQGVKTFFPSGRKVHPLTDGISDLVFDQFSSLLIQLASFQILLLQVQSQPFPEEVY